MADSTACYKKETVSSGSKTGDDNRIPGMHFNIATLAFKGRHRHLEGPFSEAYFRNSIQQVRLAILSAFFLCAVYGIFDYWSGATANPIIRIARFAVMIPVCLAIFILSYRSWFRRRMQPLLSAGIFVVGAAMIAMIAAAPPELRFAYLAGFVQVVFYACTLLRIRFIWAATVVWSLVLFYMAIEIWIIESTPSVLLANLFFLAGTALMGMMASYAIEYYTRREYFLLHQLNLKSDQLATANNQLEQRVRQRTRALQESQKQFKSIFESTPAGIVILDASDGRIINVNPAAARLIGLPTEEIVGREFVRFVSQPPQDASFPDRNRREAIIKSAGDTDIPILKTEHLFTLNRRKHIAVSFIDISSIKTAEAAKRQAERRMVQAQHLQALGTMAGGIAHDFNNILYGMLGFTELALDDAVPGSDQEANLQEVLAGGKRARDLIAQILAFSRQSKAEKKPVDLAPLIKEAVKLLRASLPTSINIETTIEENLDTVAANPSQIHQVILNLCTNAAHAMEGGTGSVKVAAGNVSLADSRMTSHGVLPPGRYVSITVSDTGCGMSDKVLERIFEPFFTTKEQGKGTGMGLAVVHGIVESHEGLIDVKSSRGKGSTFKIYLPAIKVAKTGQTSSKKQFPSGNEHILFVDDEKPLRTMVADTLGRLGYSVETCQDGIAAWEIFRSNPRKFKMVITDLTMPKMNGLELARKIRRNRPDAPIIICTGFTPNTGSLEEESLAGIHILNKPIDRHKLALAIRKALDSPRIQA